MSIKKYSNKITLAILIIGILTSCDKKIHWDVDEGQTRLIVEAYFTDQFIKQSIKLTKTASFYSKNVPSPVSGAQVEVRDGTNIYKFLEETPGSGIYLTHDSVAGEVGKGYQLTINLIEPIGGITNYTSSCSMKPAMKIDSITSEENIQNFFGVEDKSKEVRMWGRELPEEGDYYMVKLYINSHLESDTLSKISFINDEAINGYYFASTINVLFRTNKINDGDTLSINLYSINKDYFNFINNMLQESG